MAFAIGVNSGFVTTSPSVDPNTGATNTADSRENATKDTSPAAGGTITEMGWWCSNATEEANWECGIYDESGGVPNNLLQSNTSNAKGTDAGWKICTGLNWDFNGNTAYWLGVQCDNTTTTTYMDMKTSTGYGMDNIYAPNNLINPFNGGALQDDDGGICIYALYESGSPTLSYTSVNIGDEWKSVSGANVVKVNIGDDWKNVSAMKVNVGDAWKAVTIA